MIFLTVGTQEPFPRLVQAIEALAEATPEDIFAQTLDWENRGQMQSMHSISQDAFNAVCTRARCIVGHAGIGTYLAAKRFRKPLICMPRRRHLKEHRTDHQWDTALALRERPGVQIVESEPELRRALAKADEPVSGEPDGYENLLSELSRLVA